jgi:hypothetical protein
MLALVRLLENAANAAPHVAAAQRCCVSQLVSVIVLCMMVQVIGMLQQVVQETLPNTTELVTPPQRAAASSTQDPPAVPAGSAASPGQPRPPYTLREGVGLRRLLKFRVQASVQLLLVQAASEVYAQHYQHLTVRNWQDLA